MTGQDQQACFSPPCSAIDEIDGQSPRRGPVMLIFPLPPENLPCFGGFSNRTTKHTNMAFCLKALMN